MLTKINRWLVFALFLFVIVASFVGLRFVSFDNNIELMLPRDKDVLRSLRFFKESQFSNRVVISLGLKSSSSNIDDLIRATDSLAESLKSPLITEVINGIPQETNTVSEMMGFLRYAPQLLDKQTLAAAEARINPEGVKECLRNDYHKLLTPAGTFLAPFIRFDPLGIKFSLIDNIGKISSSFGYKVKIINGHFISADEKHALLILKTPVKITDGFGSRKLINYLQEKTTALPDYIGADIISGHMHTVSNEDVIKKDVWLISAIALPLFLLLYVFIYRNPQALYIYLLPVCSVIVATNILQLIFHKLSYFIIGMGALVAGVADDYGIHVYTAVRRSGKTALQHLAKPMFTSMLTTIAVFAAFFFSTIEGYHYLAVFSIVSIVFSFMVALFVLPHFLKFRDNTYSAGPRINAGFNFRPRQARLIIGCWLIIIFAALVLSLRVKLNSDINRLDGTSFKILQAEQQFEQVWGEGREKQAIFVVQASTENEALEKSEQIYHEAVSVLGRDNFLNLAMIWPSLKTRRENTSNWKVFWREDRKTKLEKLIREYGPQYNFSSDAFLPFFENLYETTTWEGKPESKFFQGLEERFVQKGRGIYQVLSFFPDNDSYVSQMAKISKRHPDTFLVSLNALPRQLSRSVSSDTISLLVIAWLLIIGITILSLRNLKLALLALMPEVTAVLVSLAALSLLGLSLNAPSIMAAIVVFGLTNSYGIFMVYNCRYEFKTNTPLSLFIAALTTIAGATVLLFARHPVLFSIGVTLFVGLISGYLVSQLVVPILYRLWFKNKCESC
ncbi:MAG: hypothetical protein WC338_07130 [Candidatus Ratteibacteria bacterium]